MHRSHSSRCVLLALNVGLVSGAIAATEVTGQIRGYVYDPTGQALAEVPVTVSGPTQPRIESVSASDGHYEFDTLAPSEGYVLQVNIPGFKPIEQADIKVQAGQTTSVDLRLGLLIEAQPGETYSIVEQATPVLNPDSAQAVTVLDAEQLTRIPVSHNSAQLPSLLPGVGPGTRPSVRGGLGRYSKMFVDGLETDDIVDQGLSVPLHYDSVENYEILLGAMDAQYNSLGLIENVVTRSGSNEFAYDVILNFSPSWLAAGSNFPPSSSSYVGDYLKNPKPAPTSSNFTPVVNFGGPIFKDKLWFFITLDYIYNDRENPILVPSQPLAYRATTTNTFTGHGKITWQATARDRLSFTFNPERNAVNNNIGNSTVTGIAEQKVLRKETWALVNYDHQVSDNILLQIQTGITYKTGDFDPVNDNNTEISHTDQISNVTDFNAPRVSATQAGNFLHETKWRYALDPVLSWKFRGLGLHQMKAGLQLLYMYDRQITGVIGNQRYIDRGGVCDPSDPTTFGFCNQRIDFYNSPNQQGPLSTRATAYTGGAFLQDRWNISKQLTLLPGLRLDVGQLKNDSGNTVATLVGWGPRLGLTYDLFADRKTLFVASYGRANDVGNGNVFIAQHGNPALIQVTSPFRGNQFISCNPNDPAPCTTVGGPLGNTFDRHPTAPHVDELTAGIHHQVITNAVLGTDFTYRFYRNLWADQEVNRIWDVSGTQIVDYANGVAQAFIQSTTPDSAYRRYVGLDLWVQGTPGRWDLYASYTLGFTKGTVSDYFDGYLANPRFTAFYDGYLPDDFRHTVRGVIGYRTSFGLDFSFRGQFRTGRPLWESFNNPADPSQRAYRSPRGTVFATNPATGGQDFNDPTSWAEYRSPGQFIVDAQVRYNLGSLFHLKDRLELIGLFVNILNDTSTTALNESYVANGRNFGVATTHNAPFQATLTLRWRSNTL